MDVTYVSSYKFLGVRIVCKLSCHAVLSVRLALAPNSFWGYYRILKSPAGLLLDTFVTCKWRWLAPCLRPVTDVHNMLLGMPATLLTSVCGLSMDPFVTLPSNWVTRRRASRMMAQAVGHKPWRGVQAYAFFHYWGHGAHQWSYRYSPITTAIHIRDSY